MQLRAIDHDNFDAAIAVLSRGFPERTAQFWRDGLARIAACNATAGPLGLLAAHKGEDAGVILTLRSTRQLADGTPQTVANLAAWYVDASLRWLAPQMLRQVVSDNSMVFTDLTASEAVQQLNERLGFAKLNDGTAIFALPWSALGRGGAARVVAYDPHDAPAALPDATHRLLRDHAELGCIVAVLRQGATATPLIFSKVRTKRLPGARVILADSKVLVTDNLKPISRFLLKQGIVMLQMDADRSDPPAGRLLAQWAMPGYVKGALDRSRIDHSYSEFVFLRI